MSQLVSTSLPHIFEAKCNSEFRIFQSLKRFKQDSRIMYSIEICTSIQESNIIFYIYYKYMNIYSKWDKQRSSVSC